MCFVAGTATAQSSAAAAASSSGAKHNAPSFYSMRSTLAGEVSLMIQQLGSASLPADIWSWYLKRAGRSKDSASYKPYVDNYTSAYGDRLNYLQDAGRTLQTVQFRQSMLAWCVCCAPGCDMQPMPVTDLCHGGHPVMRRAALCVKAVWVRSA
jgi:hypothetical protein